MTRRELESHITSIARVLAKYSVELVVMSKAGIDLAKKAKLYGNCKVFLPIPIHDKIFGTKHLQKYLDEYAGPNPLFDGIIDTGEWFRTDDIRLLLGDIALFLGYAPGSLRELFGGMYIYKILKRKKKELYVQREKLGSDIVAGMRIPFEVWIYSPFISRRLPEEIERYSKQIGVRLVYIRSPTDLEENIRRVIKAFEKTGGP